ADVALGGEDTHVVKAVLVKEVVAGITKDNPLVEDWVPVGIVQSAAQTSGFAVVELQPDQLIFGAGDRLAIEVVEAVEALAHAPVDQDDADLGPGTPRVEQQPRVAPHGGSS